MHQVKHPRWRRLLLTLLLVLSTLSFSYMIAQVAGEGRMVVTEGDVGLVVEGHIALKLDSAGELFPYQLVIGRMEFDKLVGLIVIFFVLVGIYLLIKRKFRK